MTGNDHDKPTSKHKQARSPSPAVKSTAVVKYTAVQSPVGYAKLQCNTDLNLPPSNWLSSNIDSYGLKQILSHSTGFSSFRMAHMFPDVVGEVDVVAGAECIKTLLKLPYHPNGTVSMMVHRVENTLLLDEFDIYQYLMKSDWSWMKNFFYENILKTLNEKDKMLDIKSSGSYALTLMSKFLYHSLIAAPPCKQQEMKGWEQARDVSLGGPCLPEPDIRQNIPDPQYKDHTYNRNVLWTFEDIQMLIGSDMPIFGGADRPCVSLRLRDASEPINVLTGIDYWLDNLMCNVPEVIMCYHLDGIVQKYEPIKTEDLPHLEGSKFSPKVIRNVAQNILSFLKSNATKSGHTYWLFKGANDDVVKLYDLTSLCGGMGCNNGTENPFTVPVAMLLYRVARNMRMTNRTKHVKVLLENSIKLLPVERHPQIVASSHYMLADMYVPATTNPASPDFRDLSSEESDCEDEEQDQFEGEEKVDPETAPPMEEEPHGPPTIETEEKGQLALMMQGLALQNIGEVSSENDKSERLADSRSSTSLGTSPPDRCGKAMQHVLQGLLALHHVTLEKCEEEEREKAAKQKLRDEQNPKMANPYEPIKMSYEPLKKSNESCNMANPDIPIPLPESNTKSRRKRKADKRNKEKVASNKMNYAASLDNHSKMRDNRNLLMMRDKTLPTWQEPNRDDDFSWKMHLKTLLYEKLCLALATLSEYSYSNEQYGFSLKYILGAYKCQKLLSKMFFRSKVVEESCLLGRAGDNYFQFAKQWSRFDTVYRMQFEVEHETDKLLREEINTDLLEEFDGFSEEALDFNIKLPTSQVESMLMSCSKYKQAIELSPDDQKNELLRRVGSVKNELGVKYMHEAQEVFTKYYNRSQSGDETPTGKSDYLSIFEALSKKSHACLMEATKIFEEVQDKPNLALLVCNVGRYIRFKAHCNVQNFRIWSVEQRRLYVQATDYYASALNILARRDACPDVWDLVCWELSGTLYNKACLMQDNPPPTEKAAVEVADALKDALKHCILTPGPRQYLYQFRAAMIYHRLGSLYHKQYRECLEEGTRKKTLCSLTRSHYSQAVQLLAALEDASMCLTVQLEHVALMERQASDSPNLKLKSLQDALNLLRHCEPVIKLLITKEQDTADSTDHISDATESDFNLLTLFEERLQFVLKNLIAHCRVRTNSEYEKLGVMYKEQYGSMLRKRKYEGTEVKEFAVRLADVLKVISDIAIKHGHD